MENGTENPIEPRRAQTTRDSKQVIVLQIFRT